MLYAQYLLELFHWATCFYLQGSHELLAATEAVVARKYLLANLFIYSFFKKYLYNVSFEA